MLEEVARRPSRTHRQHDRVDLCFISVAGLRGQVDTDVQGGDGDSLRRRDVKAKTD